ncbi:MAG: DUF2300 domain-containing protein [Pseudomonadota bacterium]
MKTAHQKLFGRANGRGWTLPLLLGLVLVSGLAGAAHAAVRAGQAAPDLVFARPDQPGQAWRWLAASRSYVPLDDATQEPGEGRGEQRGEQLIALGSLWKLVAYRALLAQRLPDRPLQCTGASREVAREEVYCCNPGQSVSRDEALARSCGLYFSAPHIDSARVLQEAARQARSPGQPGETHAWPASLLSAMDSRTLGPETRVPLNEWLQWLAHWPPALRQQAQDALLLYWLQGAGQDQIGSIGSRLRAKTFTLEQKDGTRFGGASGWTQSGQAFWLGGRGSSTAVLKQVALAAADVMDAERQARADDGCMEVEYFARYPIRRIVPEPVAGHMDGPSRVFFANGNQIELPPNAGLRAQRLADGVAELGKFSSPSAHNIASPQGAWQLSARLTLDEYVARVIDREGAAEPAQAARALAVAARSYALARADRAGGCWRIADSTATQRVSPRPASAAARAAAWSTAGFVLQAPNGDTPGQYHLSRSGPGVMSWQSVLAGARSGLPFNTLLAHAYPQAMLVTAQAHLRAGCVQLPQVQTWLQGQIAQWQRQLLTQAGYRQPAAIRVCQLQQGRPHAAEASQSIYVQGIASTQQRVAAVHEYLHLAFARHPRGQDEAFIESLARQLLGVE